MKSQRFRNKSSEALFAIKGLNSREIEHRLDELIETPLSSAIKCWAASGSSTSVAVDRWPVFRALALVFMFQVARTAKAASQPQDLAAMCSWSDSQADEYARGMDQLHTFAVFRPSQAFPLYYPSHGYFLVPLFGKPSRHPGALAIPLTERLGVVSIPKDFDSERVRSFLSADGGALASKFSVGTNADCVVVHPSFLVNRDLAELGRQIVQMQKENLQVLQALSKIHELTLAAFAEVGIGPQDAAAWMARQQKGM